MGFVGNNDDIVPLCVALVRIDDLVELLNQAEHKGLVLPHHASQIFPTCSTTRVFVMVNDAATSERLIQLTIQIISIRKHYKSKVTADLPMNFPRKENHRVRFSRALRMPEDSKLSLIRITIPDRTNG